MITLIVDITKKKFNSTDVLFDVDFYGNFKFEVDFTKEYLLIEIALVRQRQQ